MTSSAHGKILEQFTCIGQANSEQSVYIYTIEFHAIPGGVGIIIGDILHNLRSSLDNLAWQLALLTTTEPFNKTSFPIFSVNTIKALEEIKRIVKDIPKDACDIIYSFQPYMAPNPTSHPLWILYELSNYDKHRVITLSGQRFNFDMRAGMVEYWLNDYTVEITIPMLNKQFPPSIPNIISHDCIVITDKSGAIYHIGVVEAIH